MYRYSYIMLIFINTYVYIYIYIDLYVLQMGCKPFCLYQLKHAQKSTP